MLRATTYRSSIGLSPVFADMIGPIVAPAAAVKQLDRISCHTNNLTTQWFVSLCHYSARQIKLALTREMIRAGVGA